MKSQAVRRSRRALIGLVVICSAVVVSAAPAEYVWTGAQDAYWTNAANWRVGGAVATDAPGVRFLTEGPDWQTFTNLNATASFGTVEEGKPTTINLDGLFFVSNLVVKAGAPKYTFGTEGQYLGLAHEGGRFTVKTGATAPKVAGVYGLLYYPGMPELEADTYGTPNEARFVNESNEELVLSNFGMKSPNASGVVLWCRSFGFGGTGKVKIDSWSQSQSCVGLNLYPEGDQRLCLVGTTAAPKINQLVRRIQVGGGRKATVEVIEKMLELGQGLKVKSENKPSGDNIPVIRVRDSGTRLTFTGAGTVGLRGQSKSRPNVDGPGYILAGANIDEGAELVFDCLVDGLSGTESYPNRKNQDGFYFHGGAGTLSFSCVTNAFSGGIDLLSFDKANATLAFTDPTQLGPGAIRIGNAGRLLYTGTEALEFVKDLAITNKSVELDYVKTTSVAPSATVEQGGVGALTVTSPVDVSGTDGTAVLTLANSTASAATWAGVLTNAADGSTLALAKTGSGAWTLTAKNTFTGGTTVSAGTLVLAAEAGLASPVTVRGGATFAPAKGADLNLTSPVTIEDGGTLLIDESQTLPFAVKAASGMAKLELAPGIRVEIPVSSGAETGAKLVVCLGEGARVKMVDGSIPDWLGLASSRGLFVPMTTDHEGWLMSAETEWQGVNGASWTEAANWTAGVPTAECVGFVNCAGQTVEVPRGVTADAVGTVELEAGTVSVKGTLPIAIPERHERFVVGSQGALQIDGGTVTAAHAKGADDYALHLDGGTLALVGAATLDLTGSKGLLGTGSVTVDTADGAAIRIVNGGTTTSCFSTGDSDGTLEMTVGRQAFKSLSTGYVSFGDSQKGTFRLTVKDAGPGEWGSSLISGTSPRGVYAGRQSGRTEIVLQSGSLQGLNQGVTVATVTAADAAVTGRVVVVGGRVYASSAYVGSSWSGIGFGVSSQKTDPAAVRGELLLEIGEVSVGGLSPLGFGIGGASGFGLQTGGNLTVKATKGVAVFGYGSGTGEYVLSNGTFAVNRPLYVGGCLKADLQNGYNEGLSPAGNGAATGRLFARGGTLAATNELGIVVGADGRGRLEIGPDGNVTTTTLVLSNNVEGVLAFELGVRKAGTLKADKLVIAPGAKLEIDARALAADSNTTIRLADCCAVEGSFAASDVTLRIPDGQEKRFARAMILTERGGKNGLWLMIQPRGLMMVVR